MRFFGGFVLHIHITHYFLHFTPSSSSILHPYHLPSSHQQNLHPIEEKKQGREENYKGRKEITIEALQGSFHPYLVVKTYCLSFFCKDLNVYVDFILNMVG